MAVTEVTFGEGPLGEIRLVPMYAAVLDPRLGLADGSIDTDAVVAVPLANQGSALVEHEQIALAGEGREPPFLRADIHGFQLDHRDAGIERQLVRE